MAEKVVGDSGIGLARCITTTIEISWLVATIGRVIDAEKREGERKKHYIEMCQDNSSHNKLCIRRLLLCTRPPIASIPQSLTHPSILFACMHAYSYYTAEAEQLRTYPI